MKAVWFIFSFGFLGLTRQMILII